MQKINDLIDVARSPLKRSTAYVVGDIVHVYALPSNLYLECIEAGTTSFYTLSLSETPNTELTDGTVKWIVRDKNDIVRKSGVASVGSINVPVYFDANGVAQTTKSFNDYVPKTGGVVTGNLTAYSFIASPANDGSYKDFVIQDANQKRIGIFRGNFDSSKDAQHTIALSICDVADNNKGGLTIAYDEITQKVSVNVPTPNLTSNNTNVATTEFVKSQGYLTEHQDISGKANLASPTFTGVPKAPTASKDTNTTQIATTAFVKLLIGDYLPLSGGTISGILNVNQTSTQGGIYSHDKALIYDNGSNIWIGNTSNSGTNKNNGGVCFYSGNGTLQVSRNGTTQDIDSIKSKNYANNGYILYNSGLIFAWARVSATTGVTNSTVTKPYSSGFTTLIALVTDCGTTTDKNNFNWRYDKTTNTTDYFEKISSDGAFTVFWVGKVS